MIHRPDFMIVSGNGRNTGKTSFICEVIKNISQTHSITAIKVSPHHHDKGTHEPFLEGTGYAIWEEQLRDGIKDSSRMLHSGARKVFYVESTDAHLSDALVHLLPLIPPGEAVICESGGLRKLVEPSLLVLLNEKGRDAMKRSYIDLLPLAGACVTFKGDDFDPPAEIFTFNGSIWRVET